MTFKEKFETQGIDTRLDVNDYLNEKENLSQEIIIEMVFNIETKIEEIEKKKKKLLKFLKINNMDKEIFDIIKNEV
jgi:hypothetical protein